MRCSRRIKRIGVWCVFWLALSVAQAAEKDELRGDQVGWARLKTASPHWRGHSTSDPKLMQFLRDETTLNLDPTWHAADVEDLPAMCDYPLLFSQGIQMVRTPTAQRNLAEYLRRGGFLLIDACINPFIRGEPDAFLQGQRAVLLQAIPEARVLPLRNDDPIFSVLFRFTSGPPHTEEGFGWGTPGLDGIYLGTRLVGVISRSGLQCGWAGMKWSSDHETRCMEMLVNIYVHAMLRTQ